MKHFYKNNTWTVVRSLFTQRSDLILNECRLCRSTLNRKSSVQKEPWSEVSEVGASEEWDGGSIIQKKSTVLISASFHKPEVHS